MPACRELDVDAANDLLTQLTRLATCLTACVPLRLAAASELVQVRSGHAATTSPTFPCGAILQQISSLFSLLPPAKAAV